MVYPNYSIRRGVLFHFLLQGVPINMGIKLWISIVVPNFKSHNIIMSARVYFMKTVPARWTVKTSLLCLYTVIFLFYYKYNRIQSKHKQANCKHSRGGKSYKLLLSWEFNIFESRQLKVSLKISSQRILNSFLFIFVYRGRAIVGVYCRTWKIAFRQYIIPPYLRHE